MSFSLQHRSIRCSTFAVEHDDGVLNTVHCSQQLGLALSGVGDSTLFTSTSSPRLFCWRQLFLVQVDWENSAGLCKSLMTSSSTCKKDQCHPEEHAVARQAGQEQGVDRARKTRRRCGKSKASEKRANRGQRERDKRDKDLRVKGEQAIPGESVGRARRTRR